MRQVTNLVEQFHAKHGFTLDDSLMQYDTAHAVNDSRTLKFVANVLLSCADFLERLEMDCGVDVRVQRTQLMVEELGETVRAMAECDELELLDGLSDLTFVTVGTSLAFGLPLEEGVLAVCNSNLTKTPRNPDDDPRLRCKGTGYVPPNMEGVLKKWKTLKNK